MTAYYNEIDPYAAQWLRNLIDGGHIACGDVDERSIVDVRPDDLAGYTQAHFFAGFGGWAYALRLAGWPDSRPVWTGSCPCQPLSFSGLREGHADERHLWPAFYGLIAERLPAIIFGEQVASADGREWFAAVRSDLEALGYACGAADLCAASVAADHARQRIWFLADANSDRWAGWREPAPLSERTERPASRGSDTRCFGGDETQWIADPFGTKRRFPRELKPIVDGLPAGVDALRAIGNAIVPQVAAEFIRASVA